MDNTNYILYADDTNIFVVGNTKEKISQKSKKVIIMLVKLFISMVKN